MKYSIKILGTLLLLSLSLEVVASHAAGAEITYRCLGDTDADGDMNYQISYNFFRDCSGISEPDSVSLIFTNSCGIASPFFFLQKILGTGQEITLRCDTLDCPVPGGYSIQQWTYSGSINLPACSNWSIGYALNARNGTTAVPGGDLYVETQFNNVLAPCNSSPTFANNPIIQPYVNIPLTYNHGAVDPENDQLAYNFVTPLDYGGTPIPVIYQTGYSTADPFGPSGIPTLDAMGQISMTITAQLSSVLALQVDEVRNGVVISSIIRDIQVNVTSNSNFNPVLSGINGTNNFTIQAFAGEQLCFNISSSDPDGDQVTMTSDINQVLPDANFLAPVGPNPAPNSNICWTPAESNIGKTFCFTVTAQDDACQRSQSVPPNTGIAIQAYCIEVACAVDSISLNTGTAYNNVQLPTGVLDHNWIVISDQDSQTTEPRPAATVPVYPGWRPELPGTRWLSNYPTSSNNTNGNYDFENCFCLIDGYSDPTLNLKVRADDWGQVYLNNTLILTTPNPGFNTVNPTEVTITNPNLFQEGKNCIRVRGINSSAVAMGINVQGFVTTANSGIQPDACCDPNGVISGIKWNDLDGDGVKDFNEQNLSGWEIALIDPISNSVLQTTTTDALGYYYLDSLPAGFYIVAEIDQTDWVQTAPSSEYNLSLEAGEVIGDINFGNRPCIPDFSLETIGNCTELPVQFFPILNGPFDGYVFWDFGDNNTATLTTPIHTYQLPGTYTVTLTLGADGCNSRSETIQVIVDFCGECPSISTFDIPEDICLSNIATFSAILQDAGNSTIEWNFGDGNFSTDLVTTHQYAQAGPYTVTLSINGPDTCLVVASEQLIVNCCNPDEILLNSSCLGDSITFTIPGGGSGNNANIVWDFGDGNSGTGTPITHTYAAVGSYLISFNYNNDTMGCQYNLLQRLEVRDCTIDIEECVTSFAPLPGEDYVLSAWVKEANSLGALNYDKHAIYLAFSGANVTVGPFKASKDIIDGWQLIEERFKVPIGATDIIVRLVNEDLTNKIYFDDIRIHPFKASMKSFVYDPSSLRLWAELDERNYATYYEYDEEGALIRIEKETHKGRKTIQESASNSHKISP